MNRVILHCDCNAYFASVEELYHPEYKKVPMAVCGDPKSRRGIILAKNELAKQKGVATAETLWEAKKKCPNLVLAPARRGAYREYCEKVNAVYERYTSQVERFGIDESFLDVTGSLSLFKKTPKELADEIREQVFLETGLTISVGVSFNKIFAKLGSDYKKPNATTVIMPETYRDILWPLPASDMMMVGNSMMEKLGNMGIYTIGDLATTDPMILEGKLGKVGGILSQYANGEDDSPVLHIGEEEAVKSIGNGITFKRDLQNEGEVRTALIFLADSVATRMRKMGVEGYTIQITIKDIYLKSITRQKTLESPTNLAHDLVDHPMQLFKQSWKSGKPVRMLTITVSNLIEEGEKTTGEQVSFFEEKETVTHPNQKNLEQAVDKIREKYGFNSLSSGSLLKNDLGLGESASSEKEKQS